MLTTLYGNPFMQKTQLLILSSILSIGIVLPSCDVLTGGKKALEDKAESIRLATVPDRRIGVFHFTKDEDGNINGFETDDPLAAERMDSLFRAGGYELPITVLPMANLGDTTQAVVRVGVAHLRGQPKHSAELVDQVVLGSALRILKKENGWYYIQTAYEYLGWVTAESITPMTSAPFSAWEQAPKVRVAVARSTVASEPNRSSLTLSDATMNALLAYQTSMGAWTQVGLPDGRSGYLPTADLSLPISLSDQAPKAEALIETAYRFHGIPYLWGGNSSLGFDCSGFTQTVFAANGYQLPRDANMQVKIGEPVSYDPTYSSIQAGDLLFFGEGERISHVALSLGGPRFIHASAFVMTNSLDPQSPEYSAYRQKTLKEVRRITPMAINQ